MKVSQVRALCDTVWGPGWLLRPFIGRSDGGGCHVVRPPDFCPKCGAAPGSSVPPNSRVAQFECSQANCPCRVVAGAPGVEYLYCPSLSEETECSGKSSSSYYDGSMR